MDVTLSTKAKHAINILQLKLPPLRQQLHPRALHRNQQQRSRKQRAYFFYIRLSLSQQLAN
jgi:hypothetical protein